MNDLLSNLDKIHTTKLSVERIVRNLELNNPDIIAWCKLQIQNAHSIISTGKKELRAKLARGK